MKLCKLFIMIALLDTLINLIADDTKTIAWNVLQENKLDVQLLEPYSDWLFQNPTNIPNNQQTHLREKLLFFNNAIHIYGAYSSADVRIKGRPRFTQLILKKPSILSLNKTINLRTIANGYYFQDNIQVNENHSYCIAEYNHHTSQGYISFTIPAFDLINLNTLKTTPLDNVVACCFGDKNHLYTVNKEGILQSLDVENNKETTVVDLKTITNDFMGFMNEEIQGITSNSDGTFVTVATQRTLFMINLIHTAATVTIDHAFNIFTENIKKTFSNNTGSQLCIVTHTAESMFSIAKNNLWLYGTQSSVPTSMNISLRNNLPPHPWGPTFISGIDDCTWEKDDTLLLTKCHYRYGDPHRSNSAAGFQYAFVVPYSGNSWSQKKLYQEHHDSIDLTISQHGTQLISVDRSAWFKKTTLTTLCDNNMKAALDYFNRDKKNKWDDNQRLAGFLLLAKIFKQSSKIIQLDEVETNTYNKCFPKEIKIMLKKQYSIQRFGKPTQYSFLFARIKEYAQKTLYNFFK
jgi:hypothetical protein